MSRQLRPRKPKEEEEELYADELKAERNKYNYQKRRRYILAKKKAEREANPQLFNERCRKYREANHQKIIEKQRDKCAKRYYKLEEQTESGKRKKLEKQREELRKENPYEIIPSCYDNIVKMGGRVVDGEGWEWNIYLPKDNNRFWCENKRTYYKYTGEKNMTVYRFFAKVALHDCKKEDHGYKEQKRTILFDPAEKEEKKEESKRKKRSSK